MNRRSLDWGMAGSLLAFLGYMAGQTAMARPVLRWSSIGLHFAFIVIVYLAAPRRDR